MAITKRDVEKIAELARLELSPDEVELFSEQLSSIIGHVEKLNELDTRLDSSTAGIAPTGTNSEEVRRDDEVRASLGQKVAIENAPDAESGYFRVPRVIGG